MTDRIINTVVGGILGSLLLGTLLVAACGPSPEKQQRMVDAAVTALEELEAQQAEVKREEQVFMEAWDAVERGPQRVLRVMEDVADGHEFRGLTIEAGRVRKEALEEFRSDPLVIEAGKAEAQLSYAESQLKAAFEVYSAAYDAVEDEDALTLFRQALSDR